MSLLFLGTILQVALLCFLNTVTVAGQGAAFNNVQFSDGSMFYDLSQYNFYVGLNNSSEYTLQGRPGHQVFIYFYTKLASNAVVQVYDGDKNGRQYNLSSIDAQVGAYSYKPPFVKSTTGSLFIRITPFNQNSNTTLQDFQALATDYENPAGCDYLVWACHKAQAKNNYTFSGTTIPGVSCINLIHATDIANNVNKAFFISDYNDANNSSKLFKGATVGDLSRLSTDVSGVVYVYDKHILLQHASSLNIYSWWLIGDNGWDAGLFRNTPPHMMMSPDYLPYYITPFLNKPLQLQFFFAPSDYHNSPQVGAIISINQLKGTGFVTVELVDTTTKTTTNLVTFTNTGKQPYIYEYRQPIKQLLVTYHNNNISSSNLVGAYNNGMYGMVTGIELESATRSSLFMIVPLILLIGRNFL